MPTTEENLKTAFAGESQANRKYIAFAKAAEKEGFKNIAQLFKTTAEAETIHALAHFSALDAVKSTLQNLEAAIAGETYEYKTMYPPMLEQAEKEGHKAKKMFKWAVESEAIHAKLYAMALEAVKAGADLEGEIYLCPICGHIELKKPTDKCPICNVPATKYIQI